MLSFSQFTELNEGITKIPPKVKQKAEQIVMSAALASIYDNAVKYKDKFPKYYKYFMKLAAKYKVKSGSDEAVVIKSINYDLKYLPKNYPKKKVPRITIAAYVADNEKIANSSKGGLYNKTKKQIIINVSSLRLHKLPYKSYDATYTLKSAVDELLTTLEHELIHSVQDQLLDIDFNKAPKSVDKNNLDVNDLYFLNPIEFDPWIVNSSKDFKDNVDVLGEYYSVKELFDLFVGITPEDSKNTYSNKVSEFFIALKKHDEKKWRIAVRKLIDRLKTKYRITI